MSTTTYDEALRAMAENAVEDMRGLYDEDAVDAVVNDAVDEVRADLRDMVEELIKSKPAPVAVVERTCSTAFLEWLERECFEGLEDARYAFLHDLWKCSHDDSMLLREVLATSVHSVCGRAIMLVLQGAAHMWSTGVVPRTDLLEDARKATRCILFG